MNKQQRDYSITRIQRISASKEFKCECETPSLKAHIRRAIASGESKMKPAKDITKMFEKKIIEESGSYRDGMEACITKLYEEPKSYRDAMAELAAEQKKHEDANLEVKKYAQSLIDRIELGDFEDGTEPIRLMEAYAPKAPKIK